MYPIENHIEEIGAGRLHMFLSAQQPCSVEIAPTTLPTRAAQFYHTSATSASPLLEPVPHTNTTESTQKSK